MSRKGLWLELICPSVVFLQERTFVVGPHGGKQDTVKIHNFTGDACVTSKSWVPQKRFIFSFPLSHQYAQQKFG